MNSNPENFLFLISVFEVNYDIPKDMYSIDKLRLFNKSDVYSIFGCLYNQTSYMWMQLGFRPSLNRDSMHQERISINLDRIPPELIRLVSSFIPKNNYLTRRRQMSCHTGRCVSCNMCHSIRKQAYRAIRNDMIQARRDVENDVRQTYGPHRTSHRMSPRNIFELEYDISSITPLFTQGQNQSITIEPIIVANNRQHSHRHPMERLTRSRIQRNMPYARRHLSRSN
jgi:hypothetical protein